MSKSLGNGIDPEEVISKYGADVLRLWVASVDYSQDVSISDDILKRTSEAYRRIRNTFRFLLGSLDGFSNEVAIQDWDGLEPLDQWAYVRTQALLKDVTRSFEDCKFHQVYRAVYDFIVNDLSAIYMEATKDRLYSEAADSPRRRAVQTVLADVLEVLVRVLAPVLSFTTDEVWEHYPEGMREEGRPFSVQLAGWPKPQDLQPAMPEDARAAVEADFTQLLALRDAVTKAMEEARDQGIIKKSQEAAVVVTVPDEVREVAERQPEGVMSELLIVASVAFEAGDELKATITHTDLPKCERCWNHRELDGNDDHPDVCARCAEVLDGLGC